MALLASFWRAAAACALAGFTAWTLAAGGGAQRGRGAALIVDAERARALCAAEGFSEDEFWARAAAMGVGGALLRAQTLEPLLRSREINRFTPEEIEKLRATGLAAPGAPLEPGALWVRDEALWERLRRAVAAAGLPEETRSHGEMRVLALPGGADPARLSIGHDPGETAAVRGHGLTPVFLVGSRAELALVPAEPDAVLLLGAAFPEEILTPALALTWLSRLALADGEPGGGIGRAARGLRRRALAAFPDAASSAMTAGELPPGAGPAAALRAAYARGNGLLLLSFEPAAGVERNLESWRELLRRLRARGWDTRLSRPAAGLRAPPAPESAARLGLGLALLVLGPILALRWAAAAVRALRARGAVPQASPVLELLGGACVAASVAAAAGLAARAALSFPAWRLGATIEGTAEAAAGALLLAAVALYAPDLGAFARRGMPGRAASPRAGAVALAAALLLLAPVWVAAWDAPAGLKRLVDSVADLWWAAPRWREWLVGYPCLAVGLCVYLRRLGERRAPLGPGLDPRPWLLVGMFGPAGTCAALAAGRAPLAWGLLQSAAGAGAGSALGLALLGVLSRSRASAADS